MLSASWRAHSALLIMHSLSSINFHINTWRILAGSTRSGARRRMRAPRYGSRASSSFAQSLHGLPLPWLGLASDRGQCSTRAVVLRIPSTSTPWPNLDRPTVVPADTTPRRPCSGRQRARVGEVSHAGTVFIACAQMHTRMLRWGVTEECTTDVHEHSAINGSSPRQ